MSGSESKIIDIEHRLGLPECESADPNDRCKDCVCWKINSK